MNGHHVQEENVILRSMKMKREKFSSLLTQGSTYFVHRQGCCSVLKVDGPSGPPTNLVWPGKNSGGPKQKNHK